MTNRELAEAFTERFGRPMTQGSAQSYGNNHHLRKDEGVRSPAAQRGRYGPEQVAWAREHVPGHTTHEIVDGYRERFGETLTKGRLQRLKREAGVRQGTHGGFAKGVPAWNKGRKWDEWMSEEGQRRVREGQAYKPSHRPHNAYHELLDVRENEQCGPMVYVSPRNAGSQAQKWIPLGKLEWMRANGRDFPEGHRLVHADHDRTNCDPENLVAVPEDVYAAVVGRPKGIGIEYHDRESLEAAVALARLNRRRLELERSAPRACARCGETFVPPEYQRRYGGEVRLCPRCNTQRKGRGMEGRT